VGEVFADYKHEKIKFQEKKIWSFTG